MAVKISKRIHAAWVIVLATVLGLCGSASAATPPSPSTPAPAYHPITLDQDGTVQAKELDRLTASLRPESADPAAQIVVLVHGYNTSKTLGRRQYRQIARDLAAAAKAEGWHPLVVGVHWPSHPGPLLRWLPQMLGYRFISGTGFPKALTNPYLEKSKLAAITGKTGLRAVLFRLQDDFPRVPLHVFAHSMGCELLIRALDPGLPSSATPGQQIEQPQRELRIQMAVLAGADLDQDIFTKEEQAGAPAALPRAAVWWITVPKKNSADAALELRRSAGRRDAIGNVGLVLDRDQLAALIRRRGLVIDSRSVPITHDIRDYFTPERLHDLGSSLRYIQTPAHPGGKQSILAQLDALLRHENSNLGSNRPTQPSLRLYQRWDQHPEALQFGAVRLMPTITPASH